MRHFTIANKQTGIVLFDGPTEDMQEALDKMAREAGYADYASVNEFGSHSDVLVTDSALTDDDIDALNRAA